MCDVKLPKESLIISDTNPYIHVAQKGDLRCKMNKCYCCSNKHNCIHYESRWFVCQLCQYKYTCSSVLNIHKPIRDLLYDMLKEEIERCLKEEADNAATKNDNA